MRYLVPLLSALALAGCGHSKKQLAPAPLPVDRPRIALEAARVDSLGFLGAELVFGCRIENDNAFPIAVEGVTYALSLEGRTAATGAISTPAGIGPATPDGAGVASVLVPVSVRFADVPAFAPLLALDRPAAYALSGEVTFRTPAGPVAVPLTQTGWLAVPRAPRLQVGRAVLRSASPREVVVEIAVDIHNPNAFAIPAGQLRYGLFLSDREVARTDVVFGDPIGGGRTAAVAVPITISMFKAGKAAARLLLPFSSLEVAVKGEAVFGGVPVPLDLGTQLLPER